MPPMVDLPDPRAYELSDAQRTAAEYLFQATLAELAKDRLCAHCGLVYRDWHALGALPCRGHPGSYDYAVDRWSCCGRRGRSGDYIDGCVEADHTDTGEPQPVHMHGIERRAAVPLPVFLGMPARDRRALAGLEHVPQSGLRAEYGGWTEDDEDVDDEEEGTVPPAYRQFDPDAVRAGLTTGSLAGERDPATARRRARVTLEWAPGINLADVQVLLYRTATRRRPPRATLE